MLSKLKAFLSSSRKPEPSQPHHDMDYGFGIARDTELSGWFLADENALFRGFPIHETDKVLDVGCGDSPFIRFCAERCNSVIYADINEEKVAATSRALQDIAIEKHPLVTDCRPIPLSDNHCDKVLALEVLEHVDDPAELISELVRVGKPGALYLLSVPDAGIENLQKKGLAPDVYFEKPNHIRIFDQETFSSLVTNAGLEIVSRDTFGFYWSMWWVFFWACKQDLTPPWHPLLQSWTRTWQELLDTTDGPRIKRALDDHLPKTQLIIARKP